MKLTTREVNAIKNAIAAEFDPDYCEYSNLCRCGVVATVQYTFGDKDAPLYGYMCRKCFQSYKNYYSHKSIPAVDPKAWQGADIPTREAMDRIIKAIKKL